MLTKNGGWIHLSPLTDLCGRMACLSFLSLLPGRDPLGSEGQGLRHAQGAMLAGGRWVHVACWVIWPMDGSVKGLLEHSLKLQVGSVKGLLEHAFAHRLCLPSGCRAGWLWQ